MENAMSHDVLKLIHKVTAALNAKPVDYPALAETVEPIAALVPNNPDFAAPLLVIAQELAERKDYLPLAYRAADIAHTHAPPGSALKRQAMTTLAKCKPALNEVYFVRALGVQIAIQRFVDRFKPQGPS
jgi:hypothetical protein